MDNDVLNTNSVNSATRSHKGSSRRRVLVATLVGTAFEWYDFFIYALAASLIFAPEFFQPAGPSAGLLLSFATIGLSFLFRPLGAALAGHFGDRLGRKRVMVATLLCMGVATTAIGLLPTYASIGLAAPVLLVLLRILQGLAAGGEWGGAALMAVEHARPTRRGLAGSMPQLGVPLGLLLATGINALMTGVIAPGDAFLEWGWRVPFLFSTVLVAIAFIIRRSVDESPAFVELRSTKSRERMPIAILFRRHWRLVVLAALIFAGNNAAGQMTSGGFLSAYATNPDGDIALAPTLVLIAITIGGATMFVTTLLGGFLSDLVGRKAVYVVGYVLLGLAVFPLFWLTETGEFGPLVLGVVLFSVGLGVAYGPQAAWYAESFPTEVRYSGVAISYALGAIVGGAFASLISTALLQGTGTITSVGVYLVAMIVVSLIAVLVLRDEPGKDLS